MNKSIRMRQAFLLALTILAAWLLPLFEGDISMPVEAASVDYPVQLMNIATKDNSKVLTENGTTDGSTLSVKALGNDLSPSWRFDRVGADSNGTFFKLVNAQSGRLLTPLNYNVSAGTSVIMHGSESAASQHWYVVPVKSDHLGNSLYYKIVNYSNTSLALTQGSSGMALANYTGADNQLWLLNSDGLQGFAGYCSNDNTGNIKAGNIGGLFGEVVEVSNFNDLKTYATSDEPYTIIVTKNISVNELNMNGERYMCTAGRIYVHSNKTIIGSYGANTLYNVQFCTKSNSGVGNNIIIKNFKSTHDAESNNNDSIQFYFGSGKNIWVDHVTFVGHSNYGYAPKTGKVDEDKFLACCYDADYCTVSDSSFGAHKYGLILGYPSDDENSKKNYDGFPHMSIIGNKFYQTETRGPGLMRWGYFHSLNNYVNTFSMAYTVHSGCDIYAENCYYENGGNVICDWNSITYAGAYAESGSKFSNCGRTVQGQGTSNNPSYSKASSFRPKNNYTYTSLSADAAKTYCNTYSGCQTSKNNMKYLRYAKNGVPSAGYTEIPSGPVAATFNDGATFRLKNVNSGLYMQIADGNAENGANVQQWGDNNKAVHEIWKLYNAGDGYYYIASAAGDGGTYVLDVAGKKTDNGTNIDVYKFNSNDNQKFMFTRNSDGSYKIRTKITGENSAVEIESGSTTSGANVQQWEVNGANCQDWILEPVTDPGCKMNTSVIYTFKNTNSGMVMDIKDGVMAESSNVQQWEQNGADCQKWILKDFGKDNYYWIRSYQDNGYALKAEGSEVGSNISVSEYSSKDSSQLFRFTKNLDGTYSIITHASNDACLVEVGSASTEFGANILQWEPTSNNCQKWNAVTEVTTTVTTITTTTTTTAKATTTTEKATTQSTTTTEKVTIQTTTPAVTTTEPVKMVGDVNDDKQLSTADAVMLQKWLANAADIKVLSLADVNNDGKLNVFDLIILKRKLLNEMV